MSIIKQVIYKRLERDYYVLVDFRKENFVITFAHWLKRKQLIQKNNKRKNSKNLILYDLIKNNEDFHFMKCS